MPDTHPYTIDQRQDFSVQPTRRSTIHNLAFEPRGRSDSGALAVIDSSDIAYQALSRNASRESIRSVNGGNGTLSRNSSRGSIGPGAVARRLVSGGHSQRMLQRTDSARRLRNIGAQLRDAGAFVREVEHRRRQSIKNTPTFARRNVGD